MCYYLSFERLRILKYVKVLPFVLQMAAPKPWESTMPMSSQLIPTSFDTINNGIGPTIEQPYVFNVKLILSFEFLTFILDEHKVYLHLYLLESLNNYNSNNTVFILQEII